MQVYWERLDAATVEKMIAVLLSLDNPDVERIDGRGGDGGRDAQFRRGDRVDFYEIKSFTDRVDPRRGRRTQVERSLAAAATRSPSSWTLVVPIDPTDAEEAWFNRIRRKYDFPLRWWGLTWLSGQMAQRPEVARYYVEDERDAILSLLREHDALHAAADNVNAVLARLGVLKERVRLLDPHVDLELTTESLPAAVDSFPNALMFAQRPTAIGAVTIVVLPRYPGAARDSELPQMTIQLRFPNTEEGREASSAWEGVHSWGEAGTLAPEFVEIVQHAAPAGLGGDVGPASLTFVPRPPRAGPRRGQLLCRRAGRRIASLPVSLQHLGAGRVGVSVAGADDTGTLTFQGRFGPPQLSLTLSCTPTSGLLPAQLLPALRLHQAAREGATVELTLGDELQPIDFGALPDPPVEDEWAHYISFVEDLAAVQDLARLPFPLPPSVTRDDAQLVSWLARLLRDGVVDEAVNTGYTLTLRPGAPFVDGQGFFLTESIEQVDLLGHTFELGVTHKVLGPCRTEWSSATEGPPGTTRVRVTPVAGARHVTRLGRVPEARATDMSGPEATDPTS